MENIMTDRYSEMDCTEEYLSFYPKWIASSQNNRVLGLESFPYRFISLGCTQAIDEFHFWCQVNKLRLRLYRGEYPYSRDCVPFNWEKDFLDEHPLERGDAVIISLPFSATGDKHQDWEHLLLECEKLEIPIFVDLAYFGTCSGIEVDLNHPAIRFAAFSTTKSLSCGSYRNGLLFSKERGGHMDVQTQWHHGIHLNCSMGLHLMKNFSPDYLYNKYQASYHKACERLGLQPTTCVHLALGDKDWDYFNRDGLVNRVGVRNAVKAEFKGVEY
jgi:hypothetical protein